MIKLKNLEYEENKELDMEVTKVVNTVLLEILNVIIESNSVDYYNSFIPEFRMNNEIDSKQIFEKILYDIISCDELKEDEIEADPIYNSIIYNMIRNQLAINEDCVIPVEIDLPNELREKMIACEEYCEYEEIEEDPPIIIKHNVVIQQILELEDYLSFLFDDWDFLGVWD